MPTEKYDALINIDELDIEEAMELAATSLGITYPAASIKTWDDLVQLTIRLMQGRADDTCTKQQAFYMLRRHIADIAGVDYRSITPHSKLSTYFTHHSQARQFKKLTGVWLMELHNWIYPVALILGWLLWVTGYRVSDMFGIRVVFYVSICTPIVYIYPFLERKLRFTTVGGLSEWYANHHYARARRHKGTYNATEINTLLQDIVMEKSAITREALHPDATF